MRLLVDESVSDQVARALREAGHDAVHIGDRGLLGAADEAVLELAREEGRVLISAETDFGGLLALSGASRPSVVLLRGQAHRPIHQSRLLIDSLPRLEDALDDGAIVVMTSHLIRLRSLPIQGPGRASR